MSIDEAHTAIQTAIERLEDRIIELISRQAEHNALLRTHEERSLALQRGIESMDKRVKPLERHVIFIEYALKALGLIFIGFCIQALVRFFLK